MKYFVLAVGMVALSNCGISESEVTSSSADDMEQADESQALSTYFTSYVTLRYDMRRCISPLCGGYWVRSVNGAASQEETYVSALDFSRAKMSEETQALVRDGISEVIVKGRLGAREPQFNTRKLVVYGAWRGMPGVKPSAQAVFYRVDDKGIVCIKAPCPSLEARKLNGYKRAMVADIDVRDAALSGVDQRWLAGRVARHGALVAGTLEGLTLDASQVYVQLPDSVGPCPAMPEFACGYGLTPVYSRTEDRCTVWSKCVKKVTCPLVKPYCPPGYAAESWAGTANGCSMFACVPEFVVTY